MSISEVLDHWVSSFPSEGVRVQRSLESDQDYGEVDVWRFTPLNERSCPLEVLLIDATCCGLALDSWSRLAARYGVRHSRLGLRAADFAALFLEPVEFNPDHVLALCQAVAAGDVHLEIGLAFGKLVATRGFIRMPTGRFQMNGVGGPMSVNVLVGSIKLMAVRQVEYEPWWTSTTSEDAADGIANLH